MYKKKLEEDIRCPLEYTMKLVGGKWKSRIICVLAAHETIRFNSLKRELCNITDTALNNALRDLLKEHLVEKKSYNENILHVEYFLTYKGRSLVPALQMLCKWAGLYHREGNERTLPQCTNCDYRKFWLHENDMD